MKKTTYFEITISKLDPCWFTVLPHSRDKQKYTQNKKEGNKNKEDFSWSLNEHLV
jgi:hypothetical protein